MGSLHRKSGAICAILPVELEYRRFAAGDVPPSSSVESRLQSGVCGEALGVRFGAECISNEPALGTTMGRSS